MDLKLGEAAPDFSLLDQNGKTRTLSEFLGKIVLLYFYPADFTPTCTNEACSLRDNFPVFVKTEAEIIGISSDSVESHQKFIQKHKLPFTLLADTEKEVQKLYGVWKPKKLFGKEFLGTVRTSFLIDEKGKISKIYKVTRVGKFVGEVLADIAKQI